jgi:signal transduction histidine kinase
MDEPRISDDSQTPLNANLYQQTFMNLIFETAPFGMAVVKSPELIFQLANPAYQKYLPAADVDPVNRRYEDVWPEQQGFRGKELLQKVFESGEALDLDDHERTYSDGTARNFGLRLRRLSWGEELAILIIIWDTSEAARARNQMEEMLRSQEAELAAAVQANVENMAELQRYLFESAEAKQQRFSQQLHSGPMQELYGVLFQLYSLQGELEQEPVTTMLTPALAKIAELIQSMRKLHNELRPPTLDYFGLPSALRGQVRELQESHPEIEFQVALAPGEQILPERLQLALFRIYQEAIGNALQHARAKHIGIGFSINAEAVLEIQDDGQGFSVPESWKEFARRGRYGLLEAAERARSLGGRLEVASKQGSGTKLRAWMPLVEQ